ncbi:MAG: alanine dehydrogenase [Chloroflexi bacterium]|nr:alanine dehydrogenase [Chloroflexota bacterium]
MIVGVPKEIKDNEYRVALPPGGAQNLTLHGHTVLVQSQAGEGSGFTNEEYEEAGAEIVADAAEVWQRANMVMKVKEPLPSEYGYFRDDLLLFTYLHLAAEEELTRKLIESGINSVAYETVELPNGALPLLTPMSEVAGRMSIQVGAHYLEKENGGRGIMLGGIPGVYASYVTIIGGGVVGTNAAKMALGMGAQVTIIDINLDRLRYLDDVLDGNFQTLASNPLNIAQAVARADLVVGAVLIPGARAPRLVTREMVSSMQPGAVVVDVAIDQGGSIETIKPTSHSDPIYWVDGVIHYGVTNMPGAVPRTSTYGLSNATLQYALILADHGLEAALENTPSLIPGVNTYQGSLTYEAVAEAFDMTYTPLEDAMSGVTA